MKEFGLNLETELSKETNYPELSNNFLNSELHAKFKLFLNEYFDSKSKVLKENIVDGSTFKDVAIDSRVGRAVVTIEAKDMDHSLMSPFIEYARSNNPNSELDFISYVVYSKKYGFPQLVPHYDRPSNVCFLLDYQVDGNTKWDIIVDGDNYNLLNNDLLAIDVTSQVHWREPKVFQEDEYIAVVFFSFTDDTIDVSKIKRRPEDIDSSFAIYKASCEAAYPEEYKNMYKKLITLW
jgi:hypothetical protein